MKKQFKKGQAIIYLKEDNSSGVELGIIKRRNNTNNGYFVNYHTGDTAANTPDHLITDIQNDYAFQIIRKDVNNEIQSQKARRMASEIINQLKEHVENNFGEQLFNEEEKSTEGLFGDAYYSWENIITQIIEDFKGGNAP